MLRPRRQKPHAGCVDQTTRQEIAHCPDCDRETTHVVHEQRDFSGRVAFHWRDCYEGGHTITP